MKLNEPSYDIKTWKGFDHFKDIMDNIHVGCKVLVSDDFDKDVNLKEHVVTAIERCCLQDEENVDAICQICVGEIGLDNEDTDCLHSDMYSEKIISTYIRKVIIENIEFIKVDEMKI